MKYHKITAFINIYTTKVCVPLFDWSPKLHCKNNKSIKSAPFWCILSTTRTLSILENQLTGKVSSSSSIALALHDYLDVVKRPMDLGTIQTKLKDKEKKYKTVEHVLNDIQLVWDNCKLYNPRESVKLTII